MPLFSYIDENEQLRGPFEGVQMHYWYLKGYLPSTLHIFVHYGLYGRSTTLEELRERNGDLNPFYEVVNWRRGNVNRRDNPYEPSSSNSNLHSSLSYGLENVREIRGEIRFSANFSDDKLTERLSQEKLVNVLSNDQIGLCLNPESSANELMNEENRSYEAGASKENHAKQFYCNLCNVTMPRTLMFEHCITKAHSGKCVVEALDVLEEMRLYNESDKGVAIEALFNRAYTKTVELSRDRLSSLNGNDRASSHQSLDDSIIEEFSEDGKPLSRRRSLSRTGKEHYYDYRKDCVLM